MAHAKANKNMNPAVQSIINATFNITQPNSTPIKKPTLCELLQGTKRALVRKKWTLCFVFVAYIL
jgi:hypothetical protein